MVFFISNDGEPHAGQEHDLTAETAATSPPETEVTSCVFNHNSQMCIASGSDGKVRIFDLRRRQGECIASWNVSDQPTTQGGVGSRWMGCYVSFHHQARGGVCS